MCAVREHDADLIIPNLWLGNYKSALDINFINKHHIKYIINITPEIPCVFKHVTYIRLPICDKVVCDNMDMNNIIDHIVKVIYYGISHGAGVLVHCRRGHHRSASIVLSFLMRYMKMTFQQGIHYIKSRRCETFKRNTCMVSHAYFYYNYLKRHA